MVLYVPSATTVPSRTYIALSIRVVTRNTRAVVRRR